jgi:hypothetical protein
MVATFAIAGLLWYFFAWWVGLIGFALCYWYFGKVTYFQAIAAIQHLTGLDYYRANKVYKAGLTGDWSEIKTSELVAHFDPSQKGPQRKLKAQLAALIINERTRREVLNEYGQFLE